MFIVFAGEFYYPSAGAGDYIATFDDLDFAKFVAESLIGVKGRDYFEAEWSQVMCARSGDLLAGYQED